ncbi:hypothetical protein PMG11_01696 [Penicillium brasilianum]|uniref:Uncharacterized protein n=1 Tax=Penicillium brasilianum TaxID=104259 RepID=A0A0F7TKC5_PENBI|nr:hypothetical protein PMG11_01696 [Penicillium brasilianum]
MEYTPMDIDLPEEEYDFKYGPMEDHKPVHFPYNPSAWITEKGQSPNQTNLAGRLSVLPLDVFWTILDECLFRNGDLTLQHEEFHTILSLSQVDPRSNKYVEEYIARRKPQHFLRREVGEIETLPYNEGDNGESWYPGDALDFHMNDIDDFLGRVFQVDCPSCFAYLLNHCEVDIGNCIKSGWSFAALAIINKSVKILEYMLNNPGSFHSLSILLLGPANINFPRPTSLGLLGKFGNKEYLEQILNLVGDPLANLRLPSVIAGAFTADSLLWLCSYITPTQAQRLQALGVSVTDAHESETKSNSWHGAALNGEEFLDYMKLTSRMSHLEINKNGDTPLGLAVSEGRLDVVKWFKRNGLAEVSQVYGIVNEITLAMQQNSGESTCMVEELLPSEPGTYISSIRAAELLHRMALSLQMEEQEVQQAAEDRDYEFWRLMSESIAIEKCKSVLAMSAANDPSLAGCYQQSAVDSEITIKHHKEARLVAGLLQFEDLARWIYPWSEEL